MTYGFRPAQRSEAKPLIGLYAESGAGKTWSALLLARGFVGPEGKIGMIETEGGRGEANVGREPVGQYLVRPIRGDFSPVEFGKAISEAEKEKLDALIVDSASAEWEGAGGVLSQAADNQAAGKKGVIVWQQPKMNHQRHFMLRLMQTPIPLVIVCMRAKYPMVEVTKPNGQKDWARSPILEPKQADDILFEMFVHAWIDQEHRLHATKYTLPDLAEAIRDNEPVTIDTGRRLAKWAKGVEVKPPSPPKPTREPLPPPPPAEEPPDAPPPPAEDAAAQAPDPQADAPAPSSDKGGPLDSEVMMRDADWAPGDAEVRFWLPSQSQDLLFWLGDEMERCISARSLGKLQSMWKANAATLGAISRGDPDTYKAAERLKDRAKTKIGGGGK